MLRTKKLTVALLLGALTVSIMGTGTSQAVIPKGVIHAVGALTVGCDLPAFPTDAARKARCGMGAGAGGAPGTLLGVDWGINRGANAKKDFYINACAPVCTVTAVANYVEPCPEQGLVGAASGLVTVNGAAAFKPIEISPTPGPRLPGAPKFQTTSTLTVPFTWTRVGIFAVIGTGKLQIIGAADPFKPANKDGGPNKVKTFGDGKTADDLIGGIAVAVFIPNTTTVPTCGGGTSGAPLNIAVVGGTVNIA